MQGNKRRKRRPFTVREARLVAALWDREQREYEADLAQTKYLETLASNDEDRERLLRWAKRAPKKNRDKHVAERLATLATYEREARRQAERATVYAREVSPGDARVIAGATRPRREGLFGRAYNGMEIGSVRGERVETVTLCGRGGRVLALAIVAGHERDLYARLLSALS
jgi:hypothetical protein